MSRDLSHAYDFLGIAEALAEAGRGDDSLEWAQRGLVAFADDELGADLRLDDFVLGAYLGLDRVDDLVAHVWQRFEQRPTSMSYARLRTWSTQVGRWGDLRPRALHTLRAEAERAATSGPSVRAAGDRRSGPLHTRRADHHVSGHHETVIRAGVASSGTR